MCACAAFCCGRDNVATASTSHATYKKRRRGTTAVFFFFLTAWSNCCTPTEGFGCATPPLSPPPFRAFPPAPWVSVVDGQHRVERHGKAFLEVGMKRKMNGMLLGVCSNLLGAALLDVVKWWVIDFNLLLKDNQNLPLFGGSQEHGGRSFSRVCRLESPKAPKTKAPLLRGLCRPPYACAHPTSGRGMHAACWLD